MTYAHHSFTGDDRHEHEDEARRTSYTRGRSYLAERRRRSRKRGANTPAMTINGRRRRRWSW